MEYNGSTVDDVTNWINEKKLMLIKKRPSGDLKGDWSYGFIVAVVDQNLLVYELDNRSVVNVNLIDIAPCNPGDWKYNESDLTLNERSVHLTHENRDFSFGYNEATCSSEKSPELCGDRGCKFCHTACTEYGRDSNRYQ